MQREILKEKLDEIVFCIGFEREVMASKRAGKEPANPMMSKGLRSRSHSSRITAGDVNCEIG